MDETVLQDAGISINFLGRPLKAKTNRRSIIQIFAIGKWLNEKLFINSRPTM